MTEIQPTPFSPVRFYDAPELAFSMFYDNEATFKGITSAFFKPEALTPAEREGIAARMKESMGGGSVTGALVDIATNPLVWLMFVTSPAAFQGLKSVGQGVFRLAPKFAADVRSNSTFLSAVKALGPLEEFEDTPIAAALMQVANRLPEHHREMTTEIAKAWDGVVAFYEKQGVRLHSMDPESYLVGSPGREAVQRINDTIAASLLRFDKAHTEYTAAFKQKDGAFDVEAVATEFQPRVTKNLDVELSRLGVFELKESYRKALMVRAFSMYGKDLAPEVVRASNADQLRDLFEVDTNKVRNIYNGLRLVRKDASLASLNQAQGREALAKIMGADLEALTEKGVEGLTEASVEDWIRKTVEIPIKMNSTYLPRNVRDVLGVSLSAADLSTFRASHRFVATKSAILRQRGKPFLWHPEDLERLDATLGGTDVLKEEIKKGRDLQVELASLGENQPAYRINLVESVDKYNRDTAETLALFVEAPDDATKLFLKRQLDPSRMKEADLVTPTGSATFSQRVGQVRAGLGGDIDFDNPRNVAEVLARGAALTNDAHSRQKLVDIYVPRITGHLSRSDAGLMAATQNAKRFLSALSNSWLGQTIEKTGPWGSRLIANMKHFSNPELGKGMQAPTIEKWLTKYLYLSHLGINMGSVALNIMQPLLHATTWAGIGPVAKAYKSAFRELNNYMTDRVAKYGARRLTHLEHAGLIQTHFKYANVEGRGDILGIMRELPESLDALTFQPGSVGAVGRKESGWDYMMKAFEKAEWLNRNVAAHTMEELYRSKGLFDDTVGAELRTQRLFDTERFVQATQFGGSIVNQPAIFMKGFLSSGLMRQFLQFPLRSFTASVFIGPRLGGQESLAAGFSNTLLRGLGVSAVVYELGKNLAGVDLSRSLYAATTLDLFGGDRLLADGNEYVPIPPVVDIPINIARGILNQDWELLRLNVPRAIPGGVGASRVLEIQEAGLGLPGGLGELAKDMQRTYVGWDTPTPDGQVPIFRGDGTLIGYESPLVTFLHGAGLDFGKYRDEAEMTRFLLTNRDEIVAKRQEMMRRLLANDVPGAMSIKREFERRFQFPLTVTEQQIKAAMQTRATPRAERILDRIPADIRPQYAQMLAATQPTGLPPEAFQAEGPSTAAQRTRAFGRADAVRLDPATIAAIRQLVAEEQRKSVPVQTRSPATGPFQFGAYGAF